MKNLLIALAAIPMLAGCAPSVSSANSVAVASAKGYIGLQTLYLELSSKGQIAVTSGLLDKATFKADDQIAYDALGGLHDTEQAVIAGTGTAADYQTALAKANAAVNTLSTLIAGAKS